MHVCGQAAYLTPEIYDITAMGREVYCGVEWHFPLIVELTGQEVVSGTVVFHPIHYLCGGDLLLIYC